jgi:5-hydroxyisourate hydrolase
MSSPVTTHVLDISIGRPAQGVAVTLLLQIAGTEWKEIARGVTAQDGRLVDLLPSGRKLATGSYRLRFETGAYFAARQSAAFYPFVEITFAVIDAGQHYHVPLLVSPYGYTTYRGS